MVNSQRPDLSQASPEIIAYIEALETEIARLHPAWSETTGPDEVGEASPPEIQDPGEPPTTVSLVTISASGLVKRTPRHLYNRQRRGGMGVFDLESGTDAPPSALLLADENQTFIVITNRGRAFRIPVSTWPVTPIRSRGQDLAHQLPLEPGEHPAIVITDQGRGYLSLVTVQGYVRRWPYYIVGDQLRSDIALYKVDDHGLPAAACWSTGTSDLFIATRQGLAIRFAEKLIPGPGVQGTRLESGDTVIAITAVQPADGVFLLGADGRGTIRNMAGFSPNKAPGAGGKLAMKTDSLVGAVTVPERAHADLFILSRLGKVVRFRAEEVPPKEGVVQGVNCMALRTDQAVAVCAAMI